MDSKGKITVNELLEMITSMNTRDKKNLKFLLTITPKSYAKWYVQATQEDLEYADELLARAKNEILLRMHEDKMDEVPDVSEAKELLKKFQLK